MIRRILAGTTLRLVCATLASAGLLTLSACNSRPDRGPVVVSVIGDPPRFDGRSPVGEPARVLTAELAEGLVRFDAAGQIEPGLAERWIVIDDGLRYIFRLRDEKWDDGRRITTAQVATILTRRLRDPANPLAPFLSAIDEVVEMTPQVLEVRLSRPRPDLLKLFAQPELAIVRLRPLGGGGPFRVADATTGLLLRPITAPDRADDDGGDDAGPNPPPEADVRLFGERASRAVVRFAARQSDLVIGGTFADWPLTVAAGIAPASVRVDPAVGLFGLAVVRREGLLATAQDRAAIAAVIDRAAIATAFAPGLAAVETVLPEQLDSAAAPAQPAWAALSPDARRDGAVRAATAHRVSGAEPVLRIALPVGSGATALFRRLVDALASAGIRAERVAMDDGDADLRLIDRVAPYDSARWYLRTACQRCGEAAETAIETARLAPTLAERGRAIALADAALTEDAAFIPLMRPLRWSLVSLRLVQFQGNSRAWHPLNRLRADTE